MSFLCEYSSVMQMVKNWKNQLWRLFDLVKQLLLNL